MNTWKQILMVPGCQPDWSQISLHHIPRSFRTLWQTNWKVKASFMALHSSHSWCHYSMAISTFFTRLSVGKKSQNTASHVLYYLQEWMFKLLEWHWHISRPLTVPSPLTSWPSTWLTLQQIARSSSLNKAIHGTPGLPSLSSIIFFIKS